MVGGVVASVEVDVTGKVGSCVGRPVVVVSLFIMAHTANNMSE